MSTVLVEQRAGIAVVTLNRPDALNAVDNALHAGLIAALAGANRDAAVRAVVITGAGDRAFCAGQDLEEALAIGRAGVNAWLERQHPREIVANLNAEVNRVLALPDTKDRFQKAGVEPTGGSPEDFARFIRGEVDKWGKVVRDASIRAD